MVTGPEMASGKLHRLGQFVVVEPWKRLKGYPAKREKKIRKFYTGDRTKAFRENEFVLVLENAIKHDLSCENATSDMDTVVIMAKIDPNNYNIKPVNVVSVVTCVAVGTWIPVKLREYRNRIRLSGNEKRELSSDVYRRKLSKRFVIVIDTQFETAKGCTITGSNSATNMTATKLANKSMTDGWY